MPPKKTSNSDLFSQKNSESKKEIQRLQDELSEMLQRGLAGSSSSVSKMQKENTPVNGCTIHQALVCEDVESRNILKTENRNKAPSAILSRPVSGKTDIKAKVPEHDLFFNSASSLKISKMSGNTNKQKNIEVKKDCHRLSKLKSKQKSDKTTDSKILMAERKQKLIDLQQKSLRIVTEHNRARSKSREKKVVQIEKSSEPVNTKPTQRIAQNKRSRQIKPKAAVKLDLEGVGNNEELKNDIKMNTEKLNQAATKIQSVYRGYRQRLSFKAMLMRKILDNDERELHEKLTKKKFITEDVVETPKLKVPEWLEFGPQCQPYNFISTLKRKLNIPAKSSNRYDTSKSAREVKEIIEKTLKEDCETPEKTNRFKLINEISSSTPIGVTSRRCLLLEQKDEAMSFKKPDIPKRIKTTKKDSKDNCSLQIDIDKLKTLKLHTRKCQPPQNDTISDYESQAARRLSKISSNVTIYSNKSSSAQSSTRSTISEPETQLTKRLSTVTTNTSTYSNKRRINKKSMQEEEIVSSQKIQELDSFRDYMVGFNSSVRTRRLRTPHHKICSLALKAPNVSLRTSSDKENSGNDSFVNSKTETNANNNEIHVKFEAELHMLNDFNHSLRQFMEIDKSLTDLQYKNKTTRMEKVNDMQHFEDDLNNTSMMIKEFMEVSDIPEHTVNDTTVNETNVEFMDTSIRNPETLHAGISIGMLDRLINDEDERIKHLKTILKIREKSLLDRTKGQLAWLEIQKKHLLETGKAEEASAVKKKQRGLVIKLQHENNEMQKLKQMQKAASKERKTILKEQRNMIKAQLTNFGSRTKLKRTPTVDRKRSGPLRVLSYHRKEMSSVTDDVVYTSRSESVISRYTGEGTTNGSIESDQSAVKETIVHSMTENAKRCLSIREAALQKRRKAAEELLQWHQKLVEEEKKITELEMAASNIINQVPTLTIDNSSNESRYNFKGSQLNVLWENMTGLKDDKKFCDAETYNLSQLALERFCKDAKYISKTKEIKVLEREQKLEDGIKKSESTLNEIVANINNITDEISELYKFSSIPNQFQIPEPLSTVPESSIKPSTCIDTAESNENTSEIGSESSLKTDETMNINIAESIIASLNQTEQVSILTEEEMHNDLLINTRNTFSMQEDQSLEQIITVDLKNSENTVSQPLSSKQVEKGVNFGNKTYENRNYTENTRTIYDDFSPKDNNLKFNQSIIENRNQVEKLKTEPLILLKTSEPEIQTICETNAPINELAEELISSKNETLPSKDVMSQTQKLEFEIVSLSSIAERKCKHNENDISISIITSNKNGKDQHSLLTAESILFEKDMIYEDTFNAEDITTVESLQQNSVSLSLVEVDYEKKLSSSTILETNEQEKFILSCEDFAVNPFENEIKHISNSELKSLSKIVIENVESEIYLDAQIYSEKENLVLSIQEVNSMPMDSEVIIPTAKPEYIFESSQSGPYDLSKSKKSSNILTKGDQSISYDLVSKSSKECIQSISYDLDTKSYEESKQQLSPTVSKKSNQSISYDLDTKSYEDLKQQLSPTVSKECVQSIPYDLDMKSNKETITIASTIETEDITRISDGFSSKVSKDSKIKSISSKLLPGKRFSESINKIYSVISVEDENVLDRSKSIKDILEIKNITNKCEISDDESNVSKDLNKSLSAEFFATSADVTSLEEEDISSIKLQLETDWSADIIPLEHNKDLEKLKTDNSVSTDIFSNIEISNKSNSTVLDNSDEIIEIEESNINSKISTESISSHMNNVVDEKSIQDNSESLVKDVNGYLAMVTNEFNAADVYESNSDCKLVTPNVSPELGSSGVAKDVFGIEAEELHRKQLEIEQEIKHLKQQQKQAKEVFFYLREIPNKPPPPYKPPVLTPQTIIPNTYNELESLVETFSKILFESNRKKTLPTICCPVNLIGPNKESAVFVFDLCKEIALNQYRQFYEDSVVSWMKSEKASFRRPLDRTGLKDLFEKKLKEIFGFSEMKKVIKWSSKKGDNVDRLLIMESAAEETDWINYEKDEVIVKDEVTKDIMSLLLEDAANEFKEIYAKKASKKL